MVVDFVVFDPLFLVPKTAAMMMMIMMMIMMTMTHQYCDRKLCEAAVAVTVTTLFDVAGPTVLLPG